MIITENFLGILKQFQKINDEMNFVEGDTQSVLSKVGKIFAQATSDVVVDKPFAVFSLKKFLALISLYEKPEVIIDGNLLSVSTEDGKNVTHYQLTSPEFIRYEKNPAKYEKMIVDISFHMSEKNYLEIKNLSNVLNSDFIVFRGDGKNVSLVGKKAKGGDIAIIELGENEEIFSAALPCKTFDIMRGDYDVTISRKGAIRFVAHSISYFFALDQGQSSL